MSSKRELLEALWPDRAVCESALSHCVMAARRAIGDDGRRQHLIKSVHRRGYHFVAASIDRSAADGYAVDPER